MKNTLTSFFLIAISIFGYGCEIVPEIISSKPKFPSTPTVTQQGTPPVLSPMEDLSFGYGWILWYIPIMLIALGWAYREFIKPRKTMMKKIRKRS